MNKIELEIGDRVKVKFNGEVGIIIDIKNCSTVGFYYSVQMKDRSCKGFYRHQIELVWPSQTVQADNTHTITLPIGYFIDPDKVGTMRYSLKKTAERMGLDSVCPVIKRCSHEWKELALFTSSITVCDKCGTERVR